jgi:hypothetical protein
MRRLILVFLLMILPLQVSWAAVCAYCPDACVIETSADSEADSGPEAEPDDSAKADTISLGDSDCTSCCLGGIGVASRGADTAVVKVRAASPQFIATVLVTSIRPDRPERPKWSHAA